MRRHPQSVSSSGPSRISGSPRRARELRWLGRHLVEARGAWGLAAMGEGFAVARGLPMASGAGYGSERGKGRGASLQYHNAPARKSILCLTGSRGLDSPGSRSSSGMCLARAPLHARRSFGPATSTKTSRVSNEAPRPAQKVENCRGTRVHANHQRLEHDSR